MVTFEMQESAREEMWGVASYPRQNLTLLMDAMVFLSGAGVTGCPDLLTVSTLSRDVCTYLYRFFGCSPAQSHRVILLTLTMDRSLYHLKKCSMGTSLFR